MKILNSGAEFSDDKKHRFLLWRIWDKSKPLCCFIMLNPSLADDKTDDPTIRRCINFADSWGYGGIYVVNVYSFISSNPHIMEKEERIDNSANIEYAIKKCGIIVLAWGNYDIIKSFKYNLKDYLNKKNKIAYCIKQNKNGSPAHPLYLKGDLKPVPYNWGKQ